MTVGAGQLPRDADGLPAHVLRISGRARRVRIEISPRDGVVLVVPARMRPETAREFLRQKQGWIETAWTKMGMRLATREPATESAGLPATIELRALGETWTVEECGLRNGRVGWETDVAARTLRVAAADAESVRRVLTLWLVAHAKSALTPWLARVADECGLHNRACAVRLMSSRWGSCSPDGRICLNAKLLFLPPEQVRYVMVHELCHTLHLNHSVRFWDEVERLEPYAFALRRKLHHASRHIPGWAEADA